MNTTKLSIIDNDWYSWLGGLTESEIRTSTIIESESNYTKLIKFSVYVYVIAILE